MHLFRNREAIAVFAILLLALVLRVAWVLLVPNEQYSDSVWYDGAAASLAANGVYGPGGSASAWFPPGYPFFLTAIYLAVGHSQFAGKLGNVVVGVAMVGLTYLLGRRLAGPPVGLLGALFVAVWPNLIFHTGILSSDLLAAFGFVASLWLATQMRWGTRGFWPRAVLLGLLIGWMGLVRPVSVILLPAVGLWWLIATRSWRTAVLSVAPLVLVSGLVVGAWTARNYRDFGEVIPIATNGGYNFWQVNQRYANGNDTYWSYVPMDDPEYHTMWYGDEFTKNREGYRYGLAFLRSHFDRFLALIPDKLFWLYHTDTSGLYEGAIYPPLAGPSAVADWLRAHEHVAESATFRYYEVLLVLAIVSGLVVLAQGPNALWPVVALPVLLTFFHFFFHAKDRFHIPLDPAIAILAAVSLTEAIVRVAGLVSPAPPWLPRMRAPSAVAAAPFAPSDGSAAQGLGPAISTPSDAG